jgi:prevent-host-death family protein
MRYDVAMARLLPQRELRNRNAEIMRKVEAGESFIVTRNGRPVADLMPHRGLPVTGRAATAGEGQAAFRRLPRMDSREWRRERERDDEIFGPDDPFSSEERP